MLRLTTDKTEVVDENGQVVAVAEVRDGKTVYVDARVRAEGKICLRTETKSKQVCAEWNNQNVCLSWEWLEFEICVEWSD